MIIKNEIPILEFDNEETAVFMPTHECFDLHLPQRAVFAFLGEHVDKYAQEHNAKIVGNFLSATKVYPVYVVSYMGEDVCLCQAPVGAAPAAQLLDWLIGYGARKIISAGSCGALCPFEENVFLVPYKALRDEGTSYHYMSPSRFVEIDRTAIDAIKKTFEERKIAYEEVVAWSTDGFFRETKQKVEYRKQEGCQVVEMECSALAAVAAFRHVTWGSILFTADTLADPNKHDQRSWGRASFSYALQLCLDAVIKL